MSLAENQNGHSNGPLQKIAALQSILPQFDTTSAVTPTFFIEHFEKLAALITCSEPEKLMILKSRIRGEALSQLINCPDLNQEDNYEEFKIKFLAFFDKKISLATRQQQFSNCRMEPGESVKLYAARISLVTRKFFNNPDLTIPSVKNLFEQSKLSKFLEGLLPEYKHPTLMKDPQTFQAALDFVELLEANKLCFPYQDQNSLTSPITNSINSIAKENSNINSNDEIKSLLEAHAKQTHESICTISNEVQKLKECTLNQVQNTSNANQNYKRSPNKSGKFGHARSFPACQICGRTNHSTYSCFYRRTTPQRHFTRRESFANHNNTDRVNDFRQNRHRLTTTQVPLNGQRGNGHQ